MKRKEILAQLNELRTKSDPKYRAALIEVADGLEKLMSSTAKGGSSRAKSLSKKRRVQIARDAANARWAKVKK
jgi:hypothetical protein